MTPPSRQPTPLVDRLHGLLQGNAVDHANFRGPPIDIADLSPHELGRLWPCCGLISPDTSIGAKYTN